MKKFYSIDGMKVIAAFLVVCVHLSFPVMINEIIRPLARIAVPYFFMVSGFFLWGTNKKSIEDKVIHSIHKTIKYLFWASLLYLGWNLLLAHSSSDRTITEYLVSSLSFVSFKRFILLNEVPFAGHLWYLSAYLYVLVFYYLTNRFDKTKYVLILVPFLLSANLCLGKYSLVLLETETGLLQSRNFLTVGIPYFFIGNQIRGKYEIQKFKISNLTLLLGIILLSITTILERFLLKSYNLAAMGDLYISSTFLVILIFIALINNPDLFKNTQIIKLSSYTLVIYIIHPMLNTIFNALIWKLPLYLASILNSFSPVLIFFISFFVSYIYVHSKEKSYEMNSQLQKFRKQLKVIK